MKFIQETTEKGLHIPAAALKISGTGETAQAEVHVLDEVVVVLKRRMTAMELLTAIHQLYQISTELCSHLVKICGFCEDCEDGCPADALEAEEPSLPDWLRAEAGIPQKAKLSGRTDQEKNAVTVTAAGYEHDLRDVPPELLEIFLNTNLCLCALDERLMSGGVVYGG